MGSDYSKSQERPVEGFTHRFLPPASNTTDVTLILLHGTGGSENDLLDLGRMLLPGAGLLSPRGQVNENGMQRFFRRRAEGAFDLDDLYRRTDELACFIRAAGSIYQFVPERVVAVGFSNGANIASSVLLRQPAVLAGAVLLHPMVPFEPAQLPDLQGKPVFIGAGRRDPIVPFNNTLRLIELLRESQASVSEFWSSGGHTITHEEVKAARAWVQQFSVQN